jgi:aminoglycoside N3'-acetyltransferase
MEVHAECSRRKSRLIVCGDNALAYRLVQELVTAVGDDVTVILPPIERIHGSRLAALPKARIIEAGELNEGSRSTGTPLVTSNYHHPAIMSLHVVID